MPIKMVVAVIKPYKLDDVKEALSEIGLKGMTTIDARGFRRQRGHTDEYKGSEYDVSFLPKILIMSAVPEELCDRAVEAIIRAARVGRRGDGKIFLIDVDRVFRVRTGETDLDAI